MGRKKTELLRDSGIAIDVTSDERGDELEEFVGSKITTATEVEPLVEESGDTKTEKGETEKGETEKDETEKGETDELEKGETGLKEAKKKATRKKKPAKEKEASNKKVDNLETKPKENTVDELKEKKASTKKKKKDTSDKTVSKKSSVKVADIKKEDLKKTEVKKESVKSIKEPKEISKKELKGLDVLISFDTTGSMYPVLTQVRRNVELTINKLFSEFEDLRLGIIAHGDYCDKGHPYTLKLLYPTDDSKSLCEFVRNVAPTGGGDEPECYELVLHEIRTGIDWDENRKKLVILIGDATPHELDYRDNVDHLDWRKEAKGIGKLGIPIYAVHALPRWRGHSYDFYTKLAEMTNGTYLTLDNFNEIVELIKASMYSTTYTEEQVNEYISVIRKEGKLSSPFAGNLQRLFGVKVDVGHRRTGKEDKSKTVEGLNPVPDGRFQVMDVDEEASIKQFLESNGIEFKAGRTFYELLKTETVHQYKEIILEDKETKEKYYGSDVRSKLGLLPQCSRSEKYANEKLKPSKDSEYTIFVQSTSYNRKLPANSRVLYEVPDFE